MENLKTYFSRQDASLSKAERLEQAFLDLMRDGILKSGDAIPPQRDIAATFNMALSVVTKVCNKLKKQGILYGERGRGSFVAFNEQFAHDIGDRFSLDDDYLSEKDRPHVHDDLIFCNLVERLSFLNEPLPSEMHFGAPNAKRSSLKAYGADYLRQHGCFIRPEDVMMSHNAYVALWTALQTCCPSGSVVGVPELSFAPLFRNRLVAHNVEFVPLACDQYGVMPETLETACRAHHLKVLICSPECELPTTKRMDKQRRQDIAQLARQYNLTVIENNWLLPAGKDSEIPALAMFVPERTIFLEHGTKMLSCEMFCSFSYVPQQFYDKFIYLRNITSGPLSLLARKITQLWIDNGYMDRDFTKKNEEIVRRNELAREILEPLPVKIHKYARYCWLPLSGKNSEHALCQRLHRQGVLVSTSRNYRIGSVCSEEGILIGLGYEPSIQRLEEALQLIKTEVLMN